MRKTNVFGKRISQVKVVYFIAIIFALVFGARVYILNLQEERLTYYQDQESEILSRINAIVNSNTEETYHLIGEIIQYLPNTYTSQQIQDEVEFVMNLSELSLATDISVALAEQATTPFGNLVTTTVKAIKVSLSFTTDTPDQVLDFVTNLYAQDRIYYIESSHVSINSLGSADVSFVFYTFYNNVSVS